MAPRLIAVSLVLVCSEEFSQFGDRFKPGQEVPEEVVAKWDPDLVATRLTNGFLRYDQRHTPYIPPVTALATGGERATGDLDPSMGAVGDSGSLEEGAGGASANEETTEQMNDPLLHPELLEEYSRAELLTYCEDVLGEALPKNLSTKDTLLEVRRVIAEKALPGS